MKIDSFFSLKKGKKKKKSDQKYFSSRYIRKTATITKIEICGVQIVVERILDPEISWRRKYPI